MKCRSCKKESRFYVPGEPLNFCEHCGEAMDAATERWADKQARTLPTPNSDRE